MRILQVVTYISPDGAYGGPVRVAINQAKALTELGHDVVIAAAAGGFQGPLPSEFDGFPVQLFPARRVAPRSGFAGITSPGLLSWLVRAIRRADVVHIHLARDLVTLPAAALTLLARKPLVIQTHGMIDQTDKKLARPLDRFLTRPILRGASRVLFLTDRERDDLTSVVGEGLDLVRLPNGVTLPALRAIEQVEGPQAYPEVLFLARLHSRKRPLVFARAAATLGTQWQHARFSLVGPDEGEGPGISTAIEAMNKGDHIRWEGSVDPDQTLNRMSQASVYALPSTEEPFPMAVLEAMSLGLPVVITQSCGLASFVLENEAGVVCDHSQDELDVALGRLLDDPELRIAMGGRAREAVKAAYGMPLVVKKLSNIYSGVSNSQESLS